KTSNKLTVREKKVLCDGVEDRTVKLLCGMVQSSTTTDKTQPPQTDKKKPQLITVGASVL
ncbi:hypothetical protein WAI85_22225, partial [Acinetobacter baumannii]